MGTIAMRQARTRTIDHKITNLLFLQLSLLDRLVGLMAKASASRAEIRGSILARTVGIFPGRVIQVT